LFVVSRRATGETKEPHDIKVTVLVEVADEADVKIPEPCIGQIPLTGIVGFRDTPADHLNEIAPVHGVAEEGSERQQRASESRLARASSDVADEKRSVVGLAEMNLEVPPEKASSEKGSN
jgi:hypothetical protein